MKKIIITVSCLPIWHLISTYAITIAKGKGFMQRFKDEFDLRVDWEITVSSASQPNWDER